MKILHIGNLKSGIDTYVRNTVLMAKKDLDFVIVNGADDNNIPYIRNGIEVSSYTIDMYRNLNPIKDLKAIIQTVRIIKKECPDIIHCHSAKGGVIGRVAGFLTGIKTAYTAHAFSFLSAENSRKRKIFLFLERITKFKAWLIACSHSEIMLGMKEVGYKESKSFEWSNAIPDVFNINNINDTSLGCYICSIGRPSYQKNPLLMVEAARIIHQYFPDIKFLMLGTGFYSPLLEDMKNKIEDYKLNDCFILKSWLSHSETLGYLKKSSIFLSTSIYEGLPIAVLEAMACGKAIVATNVIGNRDCLTDGESGLLSTMDAKNIAEKIILLLTDEQLRMKIEHGARKAFEKNFLLDNRIKDLENIYEYIYSN